MLFTPLQFESARSWFFKLRDSWVLFMDNEFRTEDTTCCQKNRPFDFIPVSIWFVFARVLSSSDSLCSQLVRKFESNRHSLLTGFVICIKYYWVATKIEPKEMYKSVIRTWNTMMWRFGQNHANDNFLRWAAWLTTCEVWASCLCATRTVSETRTREE